MLGNREDAEDALQEAFIRGYRFLSSCDPQRFDAWLFRILANRCRTYGGRRQRRERTIVGNNPDVMEASEEHPAERLAWQEEIRHALQALDANQREAFLLKYVEERSYQEISEMTGVSMSALKMRVKRACDRLRERLQEVYHV
jgi:RNA polymerase sigma-70 factor (ECF subfamily)